MGLWLGGCSRRQKISIHSEHYISLAEYDPKTDRVSVRVNSWDESEDIFKSLAEFKDLDSFLAKAFLIAFNFIFVVVSLMLPLILWIFRVWEWETVKIWLNLWPAIVIIAQSIYLICYCYFNRFVTWHAAEHKAIIAYEYFKSTELEKIRSAPRVSDYCGTSGFASFILDGLVISLAGTIFQVFPPLIWLIFIIRCAMHTGILPAIWLSRLLQKHLTTKEPSEIELRTAQAAIRALVEAEQSSGKIPLD